MIALAASALRPPRLRGVLHTHAAWVTAFTGTVLCVLAATRPGVKTFVACAVYAVATSALFSISALYHRVHWGPLGRAVMKRLDHAMIFVFIAATYTPFSVILMRPDSAQTLLIVVWSAAIGGVTLKVAWPSAPRWIGVPLYIAMGWAAVFVFPQMLLYGGVAAVILLSIGGLFYSIGGALYAVRWPNPWPEVFGHHEFFHAGTIVGALCHYIAVYFALYA